VRLSDNREALIDLRRNPLWGQLRSALQARQVDCWKALQREKDSDGKSRLQGRCDELEDILSILESYESGQAFVDNESAPRSET
jgi:hypothetical protein